MPTPLILATAWVSSQGRFPRFFSRARQLKEERGAAWNYSIKGSFIEIYNEDLIDLLSMDDTAGGRREVQIAKTKMDTSSGAGFAR